MPKFIARGKGCRLWDMEGKEYIDFRLALGPVTLGYCYDEVDDAVRAQMSNGVLFSMASPIELDLWPGWSTKWCRTRRWSVS